MTNLRCMVPQGGRWTVSRRNFFSSASSVESKGERDLRMLKAAWRVLVGATSMAGGFGIAHVILRWNQLVSWDEPETPKVNNKISNQPLK